MGATERKKRKQTASVTISNLPGFMYPNRYWESCQCCLDEIGYKETENGYHAIIDGYLGFLCQKWLDLKPTSSKNWASAHKG